MNFKLYATERHQNHNKNYKRIKQVNWFSSQSIITYLMTFTGVNLRYIRKRRPKLISIDDRL